MDNIINVAQFIFEKYNRVSGKIIDEMSLHKLLYFVQREHFAIINEPLFPEAFEGWKYGPVSVAVRHAYTDTGLKNATSDISDGAMYIANNIIQQYGFISPWELSKLTHQEISWQNSRKGLNPEQNGHVELNFEDIKKDAEKVRPYDSVWDMYYDEFETIDEDLL